MISVVCVISLGLASVPARGENAATDSDVREEARQILADPEFRYFPHLDDREERPVSRDGRGRSSTSSFPGSGGSGSGDSGTSSGSGNTRQSGNSRSRTRGRNTSQDNSRTSTPAESASSSSSPAAASAFQGLGRVVGALVQGLTYLVLIAVCGLIVYLVIQAILNREPTPAASSLTRLSPDLPLDEDHSPGELPADTYLARARELAEQRLYREAIAHLLLGGMSAIERSQLIRYRRGLTLRDYLRSLRGHTLQYGGFQTMIGVYEPIGFGRRVASFQTFQDALAGYQQTVAAEP